MHTLPMIALARAAARESGTPVILLQVTIDDGASIALMPDALPNEVASDLFDGPQALGFDTVREAVRTFNRIVEETLASRLHCPYTITLTNGVDDDVVHSNIDGVGHPTGHPHVRMDGDEAWIADHPSES